MINKNKLLGIALGVAFLGIVCSTVGLDMPLVLAATHAAYTNQQMRFSLPEFSFDKNRLTIG